MTAQIHEKLIFDGEETSMMSSPPLPENHLRLIELDEEDIDVKDKCSILLSSACWRYYMGTWEIKNGQFYLIDIAGRYKMVGREPILANWFIVYTNVNTRAIT